MSPLPKLPFGEYAPDQNPDIQFVVDGKNVFPRSTGTYGPVASFMNAVTALTARCQGAFYANDSAGNVSVWAGDATKLYKLSSGSAFSDVSKVGGYTIAASDFWEFIQFGQKVIATDYADAIQVYTLGSSALFADLSATAPKARHIAPVANFVMVGNTFDGTGGAQPDRVWWSALGDSTSWPTPATSAAAAVQSGYNNISGNGGWVQGIAPRVGALDAIIVQERQLIRCQYVGSPDVFTFQPLEGARGSPAPQSITAYGGMMYYLGDDGFYACDGATSRPIGAGKVDKFFYGDVLQSSIGRVCGVFDPINRLWVVAYPSNSSSGGTPDRMMFYNTISDRWAPPAQITTEYLTKLGSIGYTLEQLDAFGTMETLPASLDSRLWAGSGKPVLAAFDSSHRLGYFTGGNLEAQLETGDSDSGDGGRFMAQGFRPDVNGSAATLTGQIGYRESRNDSVSYTSAVSAQRNYVIPAHVSARHLRVKLTIAASSDWTHAAAFDLGLRRVGKQ